MYNGEKVIVLIMAAGIGNRFGAGIPKQYVTVGDEPMVLLTYKVFEKNNYVDDIFLVCAEDKIDYCKAIFPKGEASFCKLKDFICGGATRQGSVFNALKYLNVNYYPKTGVDEKTVSNSIVLIHDAARPFVSDALIGRVVDSAYNAGSAIPCIPVNDTLYKIDTHNEPTYVSDVVDRSEYVFAQTPQTFIMNSIYDAHSAAAGENFIATDDGSVMKRRGRSVIVVEGDRANIKITTPSDLHVSDTQDPQSAQVSQSDLLKTDINLGDELRIGSGFDVHAFAENRKLILGGIEIPYERGLLGHSDADVLTHALMDAMLGALSLGDIGSHFPDTDEKYKGISSIALLENVQNLISEKGWKIANADLTIIAEKPKMRPYISDIIKRLSCVLAVPEDCIGLKATTTEGLGFTGREEGIGSQAIVLLKKNDI